MNYMRKRQSKKEEQEVRPSEALAWHKKNCWYGKEKYMKETKQRMSLSDS